MKIETNAGMLKAALKALKPVVEKRLLLLMPMRHEDGLIDRARDFLTAAGDEKAAA